MGRTFRIGRIAGIRIGCSWSVPLIAVLYTATLATGQFPARAPGLSSGLYWTAGAFGAVLFFASLLAHEVGHALVARHEGVGVSGIDLWLLGGMAKLETSPPSAGAELRISAIGPVTSGAVGLGFLGLHHALGGTGILGGGGGAPGSGEVAVLLAIVFGWLGFINLLLAGFNLLPASPLDGGRVLAGVLWWQSGNEASSSATAARVGQVLGGAMAAFGTWLLVTGRGDSGLWLALVGWYILASASAELKRAPLIEALSGLQVGDAMSAPPPPVPDWFSIEQFLHGLDRSLPFLAYPIAGLDGRATGLLTADAVRNLNASQWPQLRVSDVAFPIDRVLTVSPHDDVLNTLQRLGHRPVDKALVLSPAGHVVGLIDEESVKFGLALSAHAPVPS